MKPPQQPQVFFLCALVLSLLSASTSHAQESTAAIVLVDPSANGAAVVPALTGFLVARGHRVMNAGAVTAARTHLFADSDAELGAAEQAQLQEALSATVLLLVELRDADPGQLAVRIAARGPSGEENAFAMTTPAELAADVVAAVTNVTVFSPPAEPASSEVTAPQAPAPPPQAPTTTATQGTAETRGSPPAATPSGATPGEPVEVPGEPEEERDESGVWTSTSALGGLTWSPDAGRVWLHLDLGLSLAFGMSTEGYGIGIAVNLRTPGIPEPFIDGLMTTIVGFSVDASVIGAGFATNFQDNGFMVAFGIHAASGHDDEGRFGAAESFYVLLDPGSSTVLLQLSAGFSTVFGP